MRSWNPENGKIILWNRENYTFRESWKFNYSFVKFVKSAKLKHIWDLINLIKTKCVWEIVTRPLTVGKGGLSKLKATWISKWIRILEIHTCCPISVSISWKVVSKWMLVLGFRFIKVLEGPSFYRRNFIIPLQLGAHIWHFFARP